MFVYTAILSKAPNIEDYSKIPTLKKIRSHMSFTFYENSQEHIAAEI
jgi:hypothetical protein